jgi:hypothetical protein
MQRRLLPLLLSGGLLVHSVLVHRRVVSIPAALLASTAVKNTERAATSRTFSRVIAACAPMHDDR